MNDSTQDFSLWGHRWEALKNNIKRTRDYYDGKPKLPRKSTLVALLRSLEIFTDGYLDEGKSVDGNFKDFLNRFTREQLKFKAYPPENVLAVILSRVGFDLEVIGRAAEQRLVDSESELTNDTLALADQLAWLARQPAKDMKLIDENTTVLTYFQRLSEIRVVPYANVAIIGIPFTSMSVPMDLLAIPHEVGHYVFWHRKKTTFEWWKANPTFSGQDGSMKTKKEFETWWKKWIDDSNYRKWYEELFADVYGCLIAGPVIAYDFQEQALHNASNDFLKVEDKHPTPYLRPSIYNKVLLQQPKWERVANQLQGNWEAKRAERFRLLEGDEDNRTRKADLEKALSSKPELDPEGSALEKLIDLVVKQLKGVHSNWSGDDTDLDIKSLVSQFEQQIVNPFRKPLEKNKHNFDDDSISTKLWDGFSKELQNKEKIEESEWRDIFQADGWTSGGGENDPAH
jgi:hypothetical protein